MCIRDRFIFADRESNEIFVSYGAFNDSEIYLTVQDCLFNMSGIGYGYLKITVWKLFFGLIQNFINKKGSYGNAAADVQSGFLCGMEHGFFHFVKGVQNMTGKREQKLSFVCQV